MQTPLDIVQRKMAEVPDNNPVTPELAELGVVIVAVPENTDHAPVPTPGALPAKVVEVAHRVWSMLAFEDVGGKLTLITNGMLFIQPLASVPVSV